MSVLSDKLTTIAVQNVKPRAKPFKLADGKGLYLLVMPDGAKYWRLRYRFEGTNRQSGVFKSLDKTLALGVFPAVSLSDARKAVTTAKKQLADGVDPGAALKQQNAARHAKRREGADTFEAVTRDWMARQAGRIARVTASKDLWLFTTYLFPKLGQRPIRELSRSPGELRDALQAIEKTGKLETAARAKMKAGQVFRYAILEGRGDADPTTALRGLLQSPMVKHHSTITDPKQIGELLRAIDGFNGQEATQAALRLGPLVFVRPGELRAAEWGEFSLDDVEPEWRIPAARMKMKSAHVVPLSTQAVAILSELRQLTGGGRLVFPGIRAASRPMSENTVNAALRRLGYSKDEMTGHGFRSMASSRLNEMGYRSDAIERQLAHADSNKVRAAYAHGAHYLPERRLMMQEWADYLDVLRIGGKVVPFVRKAG